MKKTLVLGASTNPSRYSNIAVHRLKNNGYKVVPLGIKEGEIAGEKILNGQPALADIHTVTMYLNPLHQPTYYDYILGLKPQRIIFNPGSENNELIDIAQANGIQVEVACTLVLLSSQVY